MQKINIRELMRFRKDNQVRDLSIILANRNQNKLGEIVNIESPSLHTQLTAADEFSFTVYKEQDGIINPLWDLIIDHKLIFVKDYNEWFEITVNIDESTNNTKKTVTGTELCYAELGQVMLYNIEINTESDIDRNDYVPTVFYNPENHKASLMHRTMDKIPNYSIGHIDNTLWNIQRTFNVDNNSVCDFWTNTVAQEIGCLFLFDSKTREVNVYDMQTTCLNCGYRSEDTFTICPDCGENHIHLPYGVDTTIFVDKTNLTDGLNLSTNASEIKNCFRVNGGDDVINATIMNINPNGSNYIYYFNNDTLADMPKSLSDKILNYNDLYNNYYSTKEFNLDSNIVDKYNSVINYIKTYYPNSEYINADYSYNGFKNIALLDYEVIDVGLYLNSSMMPAFESTTKTAQTECDKLTNESMSPVAVADLKNLSSVTANNAVIAMAKAIIDTSLYKAEVIDSSLSSQTWTGRIRLTSFSYVSKDENGDEIKDTAETSTLTIQINDSRSEYINQLIKKALAKVDDSSLGYQEIYDIELDEDFKYTLHKYSINALNRFYNAYSTVLQVLVEQGSGAYNESSSSIYQMKYVPAYNRQKFIEDEIKYREEQIEYVNQMEQLLSDIKIETHNTLNFQKYIGDDWGTFVSYRREDTYSNDNYISTGLNNSDLINKAEELLTVAKKELVKSGEKQFTISSSIYNLMMLRDENDNLIFEPLINDFTLGNFFKTKIDGKLYVMRLADITINYDNLSTMSCTFTDSYKSNSRNVNTVQEILSKAQNMASSYGAISKQASQGENAQNTLDHIVQEGLNSALYRVKNTQSTFILDDNGMLGRNYDDEADDFTDKQVRLNGTNIVFTSDNWRSVELALGEQEYTFNNKIFKGYGVCAKYVLSGTIIGGDIYSTNYTTDDSGKITNGTHIDLNNGNFEFAGGKFVYDGKDVKLDGTINATSGSIGQFTIEGNFIYSGEPIWGKGVGLCSEIEQEGTSRVSIYAGTSPMNKELAPFRVYSNGDMYAGGWNIGINKYISGNTPEIWQNNLSRDKSYSLRASLCAPSNTTDSFINLTKAYDDGLESLFNVSADGSFSALSGYIGKMSAGSIKAYSGIQVQRVNNTFALDVISNASDNSVVRIYNKENLHYGDCELSLYGTGYVKYNWTVYGTLYSADGTVHTSDKNAKEEIRLLDLNKTANFIYSLSPSEYKFKNRNRKHHGLIAQDVKKVMGDDDWGLYIDKSIERPDLYEDAIYDSNGNIVKTEGYRLGLRYEELIADLIATVQSQNERIKYLENKIVE